MPIETFYIIPHTISNKLVSKEIAQKKGGLGGGGGEVMTATNICSHFGGSGSVPPRSSCLKTSIHVSIDV